MAPTISPPLNTMLADVDETLRTLLKRDLGRHGFDGVEIVFDAPEGVGRLALVADGEPVPLRRSGGPGPAPTRVEGTA